MISNPLQDKDWSAQPARTVCSFIKSLILSRLNEADAERRAMDWLQTRAQEILTTLVWSFSENSLPYFKFPCSSCRLFYFLTVSLQLSLTISSVR